MPGCFAENFVRGAGNTLHAIWWGAEVVTLNIERLTSLCLVKSREDIGKDNWKGDIRSGGREITFSHTFSVICANFET